MLTLYIAPVSHPGIFTTVDVADYSDVEDLEAYCEKIMADVGHEGEEYFFPVIEPYIPGRTHEHMGCEAACELEAEFLDAELDKNVDLYLAYLNQVDANGSYQDCIDAFSGEYADGSTYAEEYLEACGDLDKIPSYIRNYIDFESVWECELQYYCSVADAPNGGIYIFRD